MGCILSEKRLTVDECHSLGEPEEALAQGWLLEVVPKQGTAILDVYMNRRIPLLFDASLEQEMILLEKKFVEVSGHGWISGEDKWIAIIVEDITGPSSKVRTIDEILNDPHPKIFDPEKVPPIVMSDEEWDSFDRALRESRGRRES